MKNKYSVNATVPYKTKIIKFTKNTRQKNSNSQNV